MCYDILIIVSVGMFLSLIIVPIIWGTMRHVFKVPEGWAGLLYQHGLYVRRNNAGRHVIWGSGWAVKLIDLRKTSLVLAGQEVLTTDNVGLKLSLLITCQIMDPAKATHETQNWSADLYHAAQLAVRAVVGGVTVEALLKQRLDLGTQLLARVQPDGTKLGITVHAVEIKDVIFSAELKRAFAEVIKARQEGLAALERARGESAALRNLANAARVLEGNPALMNLRLLQSLATSQNAGNTLVMGLPHGFVPLNGDKLKMT